MMLTPQLSLRDNPLVTRFVNSCAREIMYNTPSLLELAARVIKLKKLPYTSEDLPRNLVYYLSSGQRCVNPKCKGKTGFVAVGSCDVMVSAVHLPHKPYLGWISA